jgi:carbon storage regulator
MLVLSRKVGDKLVIDGNITVEVVKISGNRISLGIVALQISKYSVVS